MTARNTKRGLPCGKPTSMISSTTGLDNALKNVNTTIKGTQTQLKDVQKLLKLDTSNTELLSQKQRLLKEAIGATKDKLDSLKTAQEQAKKQLEEGTLGQDKYDALQREIEETEQALKQLESQVSTTYAKLEKIDEVGKKMQQTSSHFHLFFLPFLITSKNRWLVVILMFPQYLLLPIIFLKIRSKRSFNHGGLKLPCFLTYFLKLFIYWSLYADIKINAIFFRSGHFYSPLS